MRVAVEVTANLRGEDKQRPILSCARCVIDSAIEDPDRQIDQNTKPGYSLFRVDFNGKKISAIAIYQKVYDKVRNKWDKDPNLSYPIVLDGIERKAQVAPFGQQSIGGIKENRFLPYFVKIRKFQTIISLKENGDANYSWIINWMNLSNEEISLLPLNFFMEIDRKNDETKSNVIVKTLAIGDKAVQSPGQCYKRSGFFLGIDGRKFEMGQFLIPFHIIGKLPPAGNNKKADEIKVALDFLVTNNGMKDMFKPKGTFYRSEFRYPTDISELTIFPPKGWEIQLNPTQKHPNSIAVLGTDTEIVDEKETSEVLRPKSNANQVFWKLKNPKLTYAYKLNFRCMQEQEPNVENNKRSFS